jgi:hypothetical protein
MYYNIDWHIRIGSYSLTLVDSVEIHKSVDVLADTATIVLPGQNLNNALEIEGKIKRGDAVTIQIGYDGVMTPEFEGYLESVATDDGSIKLTCEDGLWLMRKPVPNIELKNVSSKDVVAYLIAEINKSGEIKLSLNCDYELKYDKFVINNAMAYDVLKKLQEETKGNIYMMGRVLHYHPAYIEKFGDVAYDFAVNIEKSDLTYKRADERSYQVEVEGIGKDGKRTTVLIGTTGGEKRTIKIAGITDESSLRKRGEEELKYLVYDGYEGSITGWYLPLVEPGYSAKIQDEDYEYKTGVYYVVAVTTTMSEGGVVRKIQLGRKLA